MTDTVDYIKNEPILQITPIDYDFASNSPAPSDLRIKVTLPKDQQYKLPVFQDIQILFTVKWASS